MFNLLRKKDGNQVQAIFLVLIHICQEKQTNVDVLCTYVSDSNWLHTALFVEPLYNI